MVSYIHTYVHRRLNGASQGQLITDVIERNGSSKAGDLAAHDLFKFCVRPRLLLL